MASRTVARREDVQALLRRANTVFAERSAGVPTAWSEAATRFPIAANSSR
jgi:hypothetical protein